MGRKRKYTSEFKAKVAFKAAKADKTISQIASEYGLHPLLYFLIMLPSLCYLSLSLTHFFTSPKDGIKGAKGKD
ncbi:MAG: transposase [Thermotogaceae bacterium]|nr:transposase [Thermotogaceae bacterium]